MSLSVLSWKFLARVRELPLTILVAALLCATPAFADEDKASTEPEQIGESPLFSLGSLDYTPGRGLRIGDTGLVFGGFINVKTESTKESGGEFAVDQMDLFLIFDRFDRFRAVLDAEMTDIFTADGDRVGAHDFAFNVRRLFGDFIYDDRLVLRAGTFLTPIGYWNLILAPPLTDTVEAPLIIEENFFQQTTTGVMLHGSVGINEGRLGYSLFSQFLDPLESDPELMPPDASIGFRLNYDHGPMWSLGVSYQSAELDDLWSHLGGVHTLIHFYNLDILAEAYFQDGDELDSSQWGAYLQQTLSITETVSLVGRYEHYDPPKPAPTIDSLTLGVVWRPLPFMALKLDYRFASDKFEDEDLDGVYCSFSTFF